MEEETSKLGKFAYNLIDGMFWIIDETSRWWQISKISIQIKTFRRQKAALNKIIRENELNSINITVAQTAELASLNESISKLASKEDLIRSKCWNWTPLIDFLIIFIIFLYGIFYINPTQNIVDRQISNKGVFGGQISRVREFPFKEHTIISDSVWFNNKLYVAGNHGVTEIDRVSGQFQDLKGLPEKFYARDLQVIGNHLIIAGYPGIYEYDNESKTITPLFSDANISKLLINSFATINYKKKQFIFGTMGNGIFRTKGEKITSIPNTTEYIVKSFGHQKNELWILQEEGILTGTSNKFDQLVLQVLAGKKPRCMITSKKNVFIGTDQGIIAGYRSSKNREWTMLSSIMPKVINDMVNAGEILFIASEEGVFRYYNGKMDKLSGIPTYSLCICDNFLATISNSSILLYYFDFSNSIGNSQIYGSVPELGTYSPTLPVNALPIENRPSYSRMPDYGLLETDGKRGIYRSNVPTETYSPSNKPMIDLPIELQQPVFSDITKFNNKYYLATTNRGIWAFDGNTWEQVKHQDRIKAQKLCCNSKHCFAYSDNSGIYEIVDTTAKLILEPNETTKLKNISIYDENNLLLLYSDGIVKTLIDGKISLFFTIPVEFVENCHSVWKVSEQFVAVLNQGVLSHESNGKWNLMLFKGNIDSAKIAGLINLDNKKLYIALNDGRIFEYSKDNLPLIGIVRDHPVSITYFDNCFWVASMDSLYFKEKNVFKAIPFKSSDRILGAYLDQGNKKIFVFTASGLRILNK